MCANTENPARPKCGRGLDLALEKLVPGGELVHDFRMQAPSEWLVLRAVGTWMGSRDVRLRKIRLTREGDGTVSLAFQCGGLSSREADALLRTLAGEPGISGARLEHVMMRRPTGPDGPRG